MSRALFLYFFACWRSQRTPLHWASGNGQTQTVKELLFWGAQAGLTDGKQKLALHWACFRGHIDTAEELIKQVTAVFEEHALITCSDSKRTDVLPGKRSAQCRMPSCSDSMSIL
jgi:ankyrin repeat protein